LRMTGRGLCRLRFGLPRAKRKQHRPPSRGSTPRDSTRVTDMLDYLVIAPHPDDAELAMGGTILLLQSQGASVGVLDLTDAEQTPHGSPASRRGETEAATAVLGLAWRGNLGLTNRRLEADLDARARLAGQIRLLKPRCLFAPYWEDAHPDHVAASALVDAA